MIYRMMNAVEIADYEGLSTASWSSGSTGNINGLANSAWQCLYHHRVQTTPSVPYSVVLPPIRCSIACPASDGGTYDFWNDPSLHDFWNDPIPPGYVGYAHQPNQLGGSGFYPVSDKLLPSGHFAAFENGFCQLDAFAFGCSPEIFRFAALQAIAPTVPPSATYNGVVVHAIRHRVNGSPVGSLIMNPIANRSLTTDWRFNIAQGDTYEIDAWLRFTIPSQNTTSPTKAAVLVPQYRVFNSSRRITSAIANFGPFNPLARFSNINFSPNFNYQEQTYQVTISGHTGWTLKGGSNGPHKMVTGDGWIAAIGNGSIIWKYTAANGKCNMIVFWWNREIPHVEFYPGPTHSAWEGATVNTSPLIYRPTAAAGYRTNVSSTDFGTLGIINQGTINQAGTTTFDLVQEITNARPNLGSGGVVFRSAEFPDALEFGAGVGVLNADVPTSITLTRVNQ